MPEWAFLILVGIFLIILGFLLAFFGMMRSMQEEKVEDVSSPHEIKEKSVKGGGVILIGPVPIVFGSDKKSALVLMVLAIALMLLLIIFLK